MAEAKASPCPEWTPEKVGGIKPSGTGTIALVKSNGISKATIEPRTSGPYAGRGVYLPPYFAWAIVTDSEGARVLVWKEKP